MPAVKLAHDSAILPEVLSSGFTVPADRHPALVYIKLLGPGSRRTMTEALNTIASMVSDGALKAENFPWPALRYQHTAAIRAALLEKYRPATSNKHLAALRGVLKECWRLGYVDAEAYRRAADISTIKSQTLPAGRALASGEIAALMTACGKDSSPAGIRDAALIACLYGAGLRRSEAVALLVADYNRETGELMIRGGKGRKDRMVYATNGAADAFNDWLSIRTDEPGALFVPVNKSGRVDLRRMSDQSVLYILRKRAEESGVSSFSPHDLRRSFISDLLDSGADIVTAQHLAGHANVTTMARYDRRGEAVKKRAAQLLHVPYRKRKVGD